MTALRLHVVGASGGVGTTVLAAALAARAARRGHRTVVVERLRGGLDAVCGIDGWPGPRLDDLVDLEGRPDGPRLLAALPRPGGVAVLAHACDGTGPPLGPDQHDTTTRALAEATDLVVVDCSRPLGDGFAPPPGEPVVVVIGCRAHQLGLAASRVPLLAEGPVLLAVTGGGCEPEVVAEALGVPVVVPLPADASVARDLDAAALPGRLGRGGLARAADRLLDELGVAPATRNRRVPVGRAANGVREEAHRVAS